MSIAENIRRLRQRHGLSQAEFGAIAGVSDKAVSTWETGAKEPRMGAIQKLADHFHISKSDIIDDEPSDDAIKFALFGSVDIDDDVYEEVKRFAKFAQEQYRNRQG
ncbi:MAG: helix-turn-helix transcriptional regulator [Oscillospiraceae bacterium]|nr:helix-turn-helix transcriptional regulator [Oscillospiraceae bacterium]